MRPCWTLSLACITVLSLPSPEAEAQIVISREQLMKSTWDSVYTTVSGNRVPARIRFNGTKGTYDTSFGQGRLFNIQYNLDPPQGGGAAAIFANWAFLGSRGTVEFYNSGSGDRKRLEGTWQFANKPGGGKWNARFLRVNSSQTDDGDIDRP